MFKNCIDAIAFYGRAFGAKEKFRMPDSNGRIMHAEIEIGDSVIMMADEFPSRWTPSARTTSVVLR